MAAIALSSSGDAPALAFTLMPEKPTKGRGPFSLGLMKSEFLFYFSLQESASQEWVSKMMLRLR